MVSANTDSVSEELLIIFNTLNLASLAGTVCLFGITSNIINIMIFLKQGLNDTVNISLLALAISDLCSLITLEWMCLLNNPLFITKVPLILIDVQHLTAAWPHGCFASISSCIIAYITLERCLCVVQPLKIKRIITPRVTVCVIVCIFIIMFLSLVPEYATCYIEWKYIPEQNSSMLGLFFLPGRDQMAAMSFHLSGGTQMSSFGAVIIFTAILIIKMQEKDKWRKSTSNYGSDSSNENNTRNKRTVKMITLVAIIYCISFLPMLCTFITTSIVPDFIVFGTYNNSFFLTWSFAFLLDSINSSVNVFIYYTMSSKYKTTFNSLIFTKLGKVYK